MAITDGDESFFLGLVQYFLFFGEEIVVVPVLKILEGNSFFRPGKNLGSEKIWGQACKIAILSLFFACSFQNFISSQYSADGSLH